MPELTDAEKKERGRLLADYGLSRKPRDAWAAMTRNFWKLCEGPLDGQEFYNGLNELAAEQEDPDAY